MGQRSVGWLGQWVISHWTGLDSGSVVSGAGFDSGSIVNWLGQWVSNQWGWLG